MGVIIYAMRISEHIEGKFYGGFGRRKFGI